LKTITKIAIRSKGKVDTAPIGKHHVDIIAKHPSDAKGTRGFVDSKGKFEGRKEADKTALKSGQTKTKGPLHSHQVHKSKGK